MHMAGESQSLFQEGVCGSQAKIRPFVPKKTVSNDKDLARGSSVGNVTQEALTRLLAVMSPGCSTVLCCGVLGSSESEHWNLFKPLCICRRLSAEQGARQKCRQAPPLNAPR